jgi:hypothetical protein
MSRLTHSLLSPFDTSHGGVGHSPRGKGCAAAARPAGYEQANGDGVSGALSGNGGCPGGGSGLGWGRVSGLRWGRESGGGLGARWQRRSGDRSDPGSCMLVGAVTSGDSARRMGDPVGRAPLAQSAERLHGKYPVRNAMLTCVSASQRRPVYAKLDALNHLLSEAIIVTEVTRPGPTRTFGSRASTPTPRRPAFAPSKDRGTCPAP